jgi:hypothetical protein
MSLEIYLLYLIKNCNKKKYYESILIKQTKLYLSICEWS